MKRIIYSLLIVQFIFGCTFFNEEIKIDIQNYKNLTPENIYTNLKIANIILDQNEFEKMYDNFDKEIEIAGLLNLYKNEESLIKNQAVEIQIKGGISRKSPLKSLGIKFNNTYDNTTGNLINTISLDFHSLDKISAFRFRNSGNDFYYTMLKDISYTQLAIQANLNLDLMYIEQTIVFVNNIFLGVMNLRTESNANGMSGLYNVNKTDITLAKISGNGELDKKNGDFNRIDNFINAIKNDNYNYLKQEIDVDNFIDYMIFESYIGNVDWPFNNTRFFAIGNQPFRFVLFDLDKVSGQHIKDFPILFINNSIHNPITDLFNIMYKNEEFKKLYDARFNYLIKSDLLSAQKFNAIVDEYTDNIENTIPINITKYGHPKTLTEWYINISLLKDNFVTRETSVKKSIAK